MDINLNTGNQLPLMLLLPQGRSRLGVTDRRRCCQSPLRSPASAAPAPAVTPGRRRWSAVDAEPWRHETHGRIPPCERRGALPKPAGRSGLALRVPQGTIPTTSSLKPLSGWPDWGRFSVGCEREQEALHTYRPFSALKSRMPSAGPQIWMTSSLVSFRRSAPNTQATAQQ